MSKFYEPIEESVWADIHRRSNGTQERKEDDVNLLDLEEFYAYIKKHYKNKVEYIDLEAMGGGNGKALRVDITENIILFYKPKRGHILLSWSRVEIPMPFFDELADRFKIENPNAMRRIITENDGSCTNKTFIDVIDFFLDHKESLINESVWADIHRRSNGDQVRKEDKLSQDAYDNLDKYLYYYAYKIVSEYAKENLDGLCDYLMDAHKNDPDIDAIVQYVKDNWENEVAEWLSGWVEQANYDYKKDMEESVWVDIHKRSNGETFRKEDEVLTDLEINSINTFVSMYCNNERNRYIQKHMVPPPPSHRKENDYEGLIKYIEDRRDENLFTNVGDYDKIIRYIKKNWESLDMDKFIKRRIFSPNMMKVKIVECEGVPGGATPANVGGMGAAYFPGPNGEPGSGDLPSPTGIVYQQVAPFGIFIKDLKKKKKKKKFRKEDEPCVHSPNAKVYDYVDDFREYVDRTYNNMDRRK